MRTKYLILSISAAALLAAGCSMSDSNPKAETMSQKSGMMMPFGGAHDVAYATDLWNKMQKMGFNSVDSNLYVGSPPHGAVQEVLEGKIDGNLVIVKRNYDGEGITTDAVAKDRAKYLKAITIMAKKPGYDAETQDWFWAKYSPDSSIMKNPKGMSLAGKVAKGMPVGCISCHSAAPGGDYMFLRDKNINPNATLIGSM